MMIDNWVFIRRRIVGQSKQRQRRRRNFQGENLYQDLFSIESVIFSSTHDSCGRGWGHFSTNRNQAGLVIIVAPRHIKIKLRIIEI